VALGMRAGLGAARRSARVEARRDECVCARMKSRLIRAMPWIFVLIWSTGFIVARYGMPHAPPLKFLAAALRVVARMLRRLGAGGGCPVARASVHSGGIWRSSVC